MSSCHPVSRPVPCAAEEAVLDDGTRLLIRAIRPDDAPRLQALASRSAKNVVLGRVKTKDGDSTRYACKFVTFNLDAT